MMICDGLKRQPIAYYSLDLGNPKRRTRSVRPDTRLDSHIGWVLVLLIFANIKQTLTFEAPF